MKAFLFSFLLMLILASFEFPQSKEEASELLKKYCTAVERGDTVTLKTIFSDDMIVTSTSENLRGK